MSKRYIWLFSILLAIALIGLIFIQSYWIKNAIFIKEQQFIQNVKKALQHISDKIEEQETIIYIADQLSQGDINENPDETIIQSNIDIAQFDSLVETVFKQKIIIDTLKELDTLIDKSGENISKKYIRNRLIEEIQNKTFMVENIIEKFIRKNVDFEDRISQSDLQKIINNQLKLSGIKLDYEYSISKNNSVIIFKSNKYVYNTNNDIYSVQLFPNDIISSGYFLNLYFPKAKKHIHHSLGLMVYTSIGLTIIILIFFILTTYIIIKQKKLSQIKSDFINNMTHELKTPISTISLATQMLKDKNLPPDKKNYDNISSIIENETKRLGFHVEKVLQMAIFEKGKISLKFATVNIHELIDKEAKSYTIQAKSKNGIIVQHLNAKEFILQVDELHFTNIISNLIDNALKYSLSDPEIIISTYNKNNEIIISIKDNGIGISKENRNKIFDQFYRVPTGNVHDVKGFGLGLTYVKKMVEAHYGRISVISELNKGSTFELNFPLNH
ncbi:sensor histidine kinase [Bacteroidota bacterium]